MTPEVLKDQIIPAIMTLSKDPIPNIRFNVAKSIENLIASLKKHNMHSVIQDQVKVNLNKLKEDPDMDVRYYALKAWLTGKIRIFSFSFRLTSTFLASLISSLISFPCIMNFFSPVPYSTV